MKPDFKKFTKQIKKDSKTIVKSKNKKAIKQLDKSIQKMLKILDKVK